MEKYHQGETPYLACTVYTRAGALVDPTTSINVTIEDPTEATAQTSAAMTKSSTGIYYYNGWTVPSTAKTGTYRWRVTVTDSSAVTKGEEYFEVLDH